MPEDHWPGVLWCEFCEGLLPCLHSNAIWGRPCNDVQKFVVINAVALLVVRAEYKVDLRMNSFRSDTPHCHEYDEQCTERGGGGGGALWGKRERGGGGGGGGVSTSWTAPAAEHPCIVSAAAIASSLEMMPADTQSDEEGAGGQEPESRPCMCTPCSCVYTGGQRVRVQTQGVHGVAG